MTDLELVAWLVLGGTMEDQPDIKKVYKASDIPKHYTREPFWVVLIAGVTVGGLTAWEGAELHPNPFYRFAGGFVGGCVCSLPLVLRSWVRRTWLANLFLWLGMFGIVALLCVASVLFGWP